MKHKLSATVAVALLAVAVAVVVWISFAREGPHAPGSSSPVRGTTTSTAGAHPTPSASPSFAVPAKQVDPRRGATYCETAKLLGIYAHQSYGLDPDLGVVAGRSFSKRLSMVASTYRRLAAQSADAPKAGSAATSWGRLAAAVEAAGQKLEVTGYDVQSQVMILELAEVARVTQVHLPRATSTLMAACGVTRETLGL